MREKTIKKINYAKYGYLFCIPFVLAFLIFQLYPTINTLLLGFTDFKGNKNFTLKVMINKWSGLKNFITVLKAPTFRTALGNTFKLWVCNFIPQIILALVLAAWFTNTRVHIPGQGAFKVLFYLPNIITQATVAILFQALFQYPIGPVNDLLTRLGLVSEKINFLVSRTATQNIVIFIQTWMWYGYTMIIIISGILGISPDIFEAAEIDGASGWQVFWKITIPNIKTIMLFTLVTSLIGGLNMFDIPRLLNLGGPDNATLTTNVYIYNLAFSGTYRYGVASAASVIMFIIIVALSGVLFFLLRDKEEIAMKKALKLQRKEWKKAVKLEKLNKKVEEK